MQLMMQQAQFRLRAMIRAIRQAMMMDTMLELERLCLIQV
jgi:hypothetical protein